ncbi:hypothetical protein GPU89_14390 [Burkholderia cepacia]|nr:hypothetical protein [Burkholderia cepacia]
MQSIDTAYAVMQALDKECGVIGEPSLKFKSVEFSLPRKHHKFRAAAVAPTSVVTFSPVTAIHPQ